MASKRHSGVAVIPGPRTSFLDHLIPICHLMGIPLHCSDDWVRTCVSQFYPKTELAGGDLSGYKTFYVVEPCRLHSKSALFESQVITGEFKTVAGFHGNPDKFRERFWIERYLDEDVVLVYGQHLIDYLKEKGIFERLKKTVRIGNLRYQFYKENQDFFDQAARPHFFPDKKRKTLLWAPTWSYSQTVDDSPFFDIYPQVLGSIPEEYQLYVKLHPYMFRLFPEKVAQIKDEYEEVRFIDEIPLVYPFLNRTDIYLGDYSSVVYDFLVFNRPLFFFGGKHAEWGTRVKDPKHLFQELEKPDKLASARQKAYDYVFGEEVGLEELKRQL
ncbi:MAG: CDP-glycerol glycerophosphotransferase family protein [Chlamydiales bacterium]|nr:CDP-glycerol glycerophosphotransferase family protein [Chlamydiales bacterium]